MGKWIGKVLLLLILAGAAYEDCKEKQIHLCLLLGAAVAGLVLHLIFHEETLADMLLGASVGILLLLIAWISRGSIGAGDGVMVTVSGMILGFWGNVVLLMTALGMVCMAALFLLVIKRKGKKYRVPFLPFLLAAYLFCLV